MGFLRHLPSLPFLHRHLSCAASSRFFDSVRPRLRLSPALTDIRSRLLGSRRLPISHLHSRSFCASFKPFTVSCRSFSRPCKGFEYASSFLAVRIDCMCGECSLCIINKFWCPATVVGDLFEALAIWEREEGLGVLEGLVWSFVRPDEGMLVFSQSERHRRVLFSWQEKALWGKLVGKRFSQGFAGKSGCEALRLNLSETIQVCSLSFFHLPDRFACFSAGWSRSLSSSSSFSWFHESCISSLWSMSVCRGNFFLFSSQGPVCCYLLCVGGVLVWESQSFTVWSDVSLDPPKGFWKLFHFKKLVVGAFKRVLIYELMVVLLCGWMTFSTSFLGSWRSLVTRVELEDEGSSCGL